jgi:hypothetical protein
MLDVLEAPFRTLAGHVGAGVWAMVVFICGLLLALLVVRLDVHSLLALPLWLYRLGRKFLTPRVSPVLLFAFIFLFNATAIFVYMISGGLLILPIVFDLFTGLNVGVIMLRDAQDSMEDGRQPQADGHPPRAWIGFLCLFTVIVELSAFWLAIGMGITLGHVMRADFTWAAFAGAAEPRILAYLLVLVPALTLAAAAEAAAVSAMLRADQ